jgi:hypothetical protein
LIYSNQWEQARRDAQDKFEKEYMRDETKPTKQASDQANGPAYLKMLLTELLQAVKIHNRSDWKI